MIATPVGLFLGSCFAAASTLEIGGARSLAVLRHERLLRAGPLAVLAAWAVWSLTSTPSLDQPLPPKDATGPLVGFAIAGGALYAFAAWRYLELYRRRRAFLLVAITVAWILLTEALIAVAFARITVGRVDRAYAQALAELGAVADHGGDIASRAREVADPGDVIGMLNSHWAVTVPVVIGDYGGLIERFAGDATMVVFNAGGDQPDHASRAVGAALAMQTAAEATSAGRPDWPRFRAGVSTGPVLLGNVGTREQRSFAAIGDTTNVAARLQTVADPGKVVVDAATAAALGDQAVLRSLGELELKGRSEPVAAFVVTGLG